MTRETVLIDTPACLATSTIVTRIASCSCHCRDAGNITADRAFANDVISGLLVAGAMKHG
jgi:hypothetical protein